MADRRSTTPEPRVASAAGAGTWAWHPPLPLAPVPVFAWPPRPLAAARYLVSLAFLGSVIIPFGVLATLSWLYLQPALERCIELRADWILQMYARNLGLMLLVAGGLHLYFYTFGRQGAERKFDPRGLSTDNRRFFARNQVWDNMLWSCASGVTFWTAYEAGFMWAYANDLLPFYLRVNDHPVWFALTLVMIPFWASLHFYFVHRLLHWKPLYRNRPRAAPQKRQHRTVVRSLDAPHRAPALPQQHPDSRGVRIAPAPHPLPHAVEHTGGGRDAYGIRGVDVQGQVDPVPGVVPPPASPPLLRLQLRQPLHALGSVARLQSRRHRASHGRSPKAPARTGASSGRTDMTPAGRGGSGTPVPGPRIIRALRTRPAAPPMPRHRDAVLGDAPRRCGRAFHPRLGAGSADRPTPSCEVGP